MLLMLHTDKEQDLWEKNNPNSTTGSPVRPIEWCSRNTGNDSDHVVVIYDPERLVKVVLPQFALASITVPSFIRKMCRWGFRQGKVHPQNVSAGKMHWIYP
jgi:hypothetical protein